MRLALALTFGLFVTGCGQFCVGPFGNCTANQAGSTGTTTSTGLTITVPEAYRNAALVPPGTSLTLTASGGTAPYTWSRYSGDGTVTAADALGGTATFVASSGNGDSIVIRVRDANNQEYFVGFINTP